MLFNRVIQPKQRSNSTLRSQEDLRGNVHLQTNQRPRLGVIIVSYQSEKPLKEALKHLSRQTRPADQIVIVDSGSPRGCLLDQRTFPSHTTLLPLYKNVGFCAANNIGWRYLRKEAAFDYILFLNPDAFLPPTFLEEALSWMEAPQQKRVGAMTGQLLGYDLTTKQPTGNYDSTGVFRKQYGRWYDRDQGLPYHPQKYLQPVSVPALCGALMLCRQAALEEVCLAQGAIFDESFFMYKEDIDLSLRLRVHGWQLYLVPQLIAYHCRGWQKNRSTVARQWRLHSARNELRLQLRSRAPLPILYSLTKLLAVQFFDI